MQINFDKIPKDEQQNLLSSFWTMLQVLEAKVDGTDDLLTKKWVEDWYRQYNKITGLNLAPRWAQKNPTPDIVQETYDKTMRAIRDDLRKRPLLRGRPRQPDNWR